MLKIALSKSQLFYYARHAGMTVTLLKESLNKCHFDQREKSLPA